MRDWLTAQMLTAAQYQSFKRVITMKTNSNLLSATGAFLFAALVGGCATGTSSSGSMGHMGGMSGMSGMTGMSGGQMDMQAMCDRHKGMMAGKSPAEQQAMMTDHMKSMSPEMRTRMQAMYEKCKAS